MTTVSPLRRLSSNTLTNVPASDLLMAVGMSCGVTGLIDHAHPALAQLAEDLVGTELSTG